MFTYTNVPDNAPYSPNPTNRVPASYDLQRGEGKFQFSLKTLVLPSNTLLFGERDSLWLAYTQQSYWQIFDAAHSRPFRESNYEPELIYSRRLGSLQPSGLGWQPAFANLGFVHQSNGQSDPRSRSWNRIYAQLGLVDPLSDDSSLAVLLRPWWRFREATQTDNNPDITHYVGYGDVEALYWTGPYLVSLLARVKSLQADVSVPFSLVAGPNSFRTVQLHLQLFTGYGESLIDYNQKHTTIGIGISVPYGLQ